MNTYVIRWTDICRARFDFIVTIKAKSIDAVAAFLRRDGIEYLVPEFVRDGGMVESTVTCNGETCDEDCTVLPF